MMGRNRSSVARLPLALLALAVPGCFRPSVREPQEWLAATPLEAGTFERKLTVGDSKRTYIVHVPPGHRPDEPLPVVLDFHGWGSTANAQAFYSGLDLEADSAGFLAVHPQGTGWFSSWNAGPCCGSAASDHVDDVAFVDAVLDDLAHLATLDQARIYATGISNGAMMAYRLACERPERIAAIAAVSGAVHLDPCNTSRPVPVLHIHGAKDEIAPFAGGSRWWSSYNAASVTEVVAEWAARDGCDAASQPALDQGEVSCRAYPECRGGAEVELCVVAGGGHTWPGARLDISGLGHSTEDLNATDFMWRFFERHPLSR